MAPERHRFVVDTSSQRRRSRAATPVWRPYIVYNAASFSRAFQECVSKNRLNYQNNIKITSLAIDYFLFWLLNVDPQLL